MIRFASILAAPALALASPATVIAAPAAQTAQAAAPRLNLEQQAALRCSAAFAVVAAIQQQGGAQEYPPMADRGREFFVRTSARLMDDTGLDHDGVAALLRNEANRLVADPGQLKAVMPGCLLLLDSSGI